MFSIKQSARRALCVLLALSAITATGCETGTNSSSSSPSSSVPETQACEHEWSDWTETLSPTCTTEGEKQRVCEKDPTHIETESIAIDPDAHDFGEWSTVTPAGCTTDGLEKRVCKHNSAHEETNVLPKGHAWGNWELDSEPTCTEEGVKKRVCQKDSSHVETENFSALGHTFDNGVCSVCEDGPIFPESPATIKYLNPRNSSSGISGTGGEFDRYQLSVGYYEIEIGKTGQAWMAFSVPEAGQYALYTTDNPNGVTLMRYDASIANVTYPGYESRDLGDGNYYSSVNCGERYYSNEWRATFAVHGTSGNKVKLRFVKIGDPQWAPSYVYEDEYAKEINGVIAPEGGETEKLKAVAYDAEYFYDEAVGYYRMGTKQDPGKIIYAAITANAPRVFSSGALTDVYIGGGNYNVFHSTTIEGNYLVKNYGWFLLSNGGLGTLDENRNFVPNPSDPTTNCYENFVNSDGMYPVNKELYEFLVLYTKANAPLDLMDETDTETLANAWLAFCFTYDALKEGTKDLPIEQGLGEFEITTKLLSYTYYTVKHENTGSTSPVTYCNISATQQGATVHINGYTYGLDGNGFNVNFETNASVGTTLYIGTVDGLKSTFTVTVSEVATGTAAVPTPLSTGAVTLTTQEFITLSGEKIYEAYYAYTATQDGTLTFTTTDEVSVMVGDSYSGSTEIVLGEESSVTVLLYISSTEPISTSGTLAFTPASA